MRALRRLAIVLFVGAVLVGLAWVSGERDAVDEVALAEAELGIDLTSRRIDVGDIALHVVSAGPADGPPVVLLHGFPEFWYSWRHQLAALAGAGFHVLAPDLRGYNRSDKPRDAALYGQRHYVGDVLGLLDTLGYEDAFIAGHDVGGGVAWRLVLLHPGRVRRAVIFNARHPSMWSRPRPEDDGETITWFRSFFKLPWLPELVARSGDWWLLSRNLRATSRPGTFDDAALDLYKAAWSRDNAISTMIHAYRAEIIEVPEDRSEVKVPVRVVWGANDAFNPPAAAAIMREYVGLDAFVELPDASHWILLEEPERTSREMIEFFGG